MMTTRALEVPFTDHYGEQRTIHRRKGGGLSLKRETVTPILALNAEISRAVGARVRALRVERGLTLAELADRIGANTGNPKQRMWALENPGIRSTGESYGGMRLGTLYALAIALGVEVCDLLPSVSETSAATLGTRKVVALNGHGK
jgi:transcriptional regulator with XRE-family HTH domain